MTGAQKKKIRRIMIAAPKSGSGKTTITCGLLQIFQEKIYHVGNVFMHINKNSVYLFKDIR